MLGSDLAVGCTDHLMLGMRKHPQQLKLLNLQSSTVLICCWGDFS